MQSKSFTVENNTPEPTITLGNITSPTSIVAGKAGTLTLPVVTTDIPDGEKLDIIIKKDGATVSGITVTGNTVENDAASISIEIPSTATSGNYSIEVSYEGKTIATKTFTIASNTTQEKEKETVKNTDTDGSKYMGVLPKAGTKAVIYPMLVIVLAGITFRSIKKIKDFKELK